ncbi:RagB/SusD family nutrient uptake outer membrane protein [Hufsiella ginkgonis]|uniref:RagB/SusD family nutrient uptake outer membrane protein n=1 Tax=Hufsiella ginkgonis TaxID=2695274 RepID=A0A7K1XZM1_9SPHI|nr:RagB/SusD family nutrient uptake outer membrane protein [Hufsiella ginkgonis]MXV16461.1 RagB/SusD family nutrient uptake outer membrane protein [Hufsiella ginkgonis]
MKKITKTLVALTVALLSVTTSCKNYLDIVPDNIPTIDNAFTSRTEAEKYLFTCYSYLPNDADPVSNVAFLGADEIWIPPSRRGILENFNMSWDIARGSQNAGSPIVNIWNGRFQAIRQCNIFLENISDKNKVLDLPADLRTRWIAEVKFLKAFYNFQLLRAYGPIPIIDTNLDIFADTEDMKVKRMPFDTCVDYIAKLLDEATPDLPPLIGERATEMGRITRPIAMAIKAKLLVLAASPLFNGNPDYANFKDKDGTQLINTTFQVSKWQKAADAAKAAIDASELSGHKLYTFVPASNLSDTTDRQMSIRNAITERWNAEKVWGLSGSNANNLQRVAMGCLTTAFNVNNSNSQLSVPLKITDMFYSKNGVPINEDKTLDFSNKNQLRTAVREERFYVSNGYQTARINYDREPRFYADLGFDGGVWYMIANNPGISGTDESTFYMQAKYTQPGNSGAEGYYNETGYFIKKLVEWNLTNSASANTVRTYEWPEIRLADLYLLYAEALNEAKGPDEADIFVYLDKIRTRASLLGVKESWANFSNNPAKYTTKDGLRAIIKQERSIELAFEGSRFWDLRRWKDAVTAMNAPITGWSISQSTAAGYYQPRLIFAQTFVAPRDYLWPIATSNFTVNTNLVQNPGW